MAIKYRIGEDTGGPECAEQAQGWREYIRTLNVEVYDDGQPTEVDPITVGPAKFLEDITNSGLGGDVKLDIGQPYESTVRGVTDADPLATCWKRIPRRLPNDPAKWQLQLFYHTLPPGDGNYAATGPIIDRGAWNQERPLFQFQFIQFSEWAREAVLYTKPSDDPATWIAHEKGAMCNSAGQLMLDPPPLRDVEKFGLLVERNLNKIDMDQAGRLANSVNSTGFTVQWQNLTYVIPPYHGKIKTLLPREYFRGGTRCWRVRYEIDYDARSWVEDHPDKGFEAIDVTAPVVGGDLATIQAAGAKRQDGSFVQGEVMLDGQGKTLKFNSIGTGTPTDPYRLDISQVVYRPYLKYDLEDWNDAGTNWMMANFPNNHTQP